MKVLFLNTSLIKNMYSPLEKIFFYFFYFKVMLLNASETEPASSEDVLPWLHRNKEITSSYRSGSDRNKKKKVISDVND